MKKFQFRLQPLLRYREYSERRTQLEMAEIQAGIQASEKRLDGCRRHYDETVEQMTRELDEGIQANRYVSFNAYLSTIESSIEAETKRCEQLREALKHKQAELLKRTVDKKILVNLKQHKQDAYYSRVLSDLQKEIDDMVILRQTRGMHS